MKKTIKELFPSAGDNLPLDGWFQQCVLCYSITANLFFLESHTRFDEIIEFEVGIFGFGEFFPPYIKCKAI